MDQDETLDFNALRAKFQDEELLLKPPRIKPALPEKPKAVPPPHSPPRYLPVGARPSLLTSINQNLEGKSAVAPRVVFKDEKKESKKTLTPKGKDKSEGKLKTKKGGKETLDDDPSEQKQKKASVKGKQLPLVNAGELVAATPPPKVPAPKKKGLLGFRKSLKKSVEAVADPILDAPSLDGPGPAPLIPVPSDFGTAEPEPEPEPEISAPKALLPNIAPAPDSSVVTGTTPPPLMVIPAAPDFTPPPAFIPDIPAPELPNPESETQLRTEAPALSPPTSRPASQNEMVEIPTRPTPTPPPSSAHQDISSVLPVASSSSPSPSPPQPETVAEAMATVEQAPPPVVEPLSVPASPKAEHPISALSALERAEDMNSGRRVSPADQRILKALEKARRKVNASSLTNPPTTSPPTPPPPEELSPPLSPTVSLPELPPVDYEDRAGQVNGIDHRQASPLLSEEGSEVVPELLVVPPPPPKKTLPDRSTLGPPPPKPLRPSTVILDDFVPPPPPLQEDAAPAVFSEADTLDVPEVDLGVSDAHSPELPMSESENGENSGPHSPVSQNLTEFYSNGVVVPQVVHGTPGLEDTYEHNLSSNPPHSSLSRSEDVHALPGSPADNSLRASTENVYESINTSATKKKAKADGVKKRKGPPKNPYADASQETNEEKSKTGRFGKTEKKVTAEGPDEKELKKREKQRLEKEKKELKERQEREKKEQKEKEKRENEMKKKFKITGQEEAMYQAKVTVTTKGRKHDLPINTGDVVSIIRTTNCPKGKWLARDSGNNYGYIAVDHVELDIKEMLELGKKAVISRQSSSNIVDGEVTSTGSRTSNHYPLSHESFTDDSEEWTCDDDEPLSSPSATVNPVISMGHSRTLSMPDMGNKDLSINHQHSRSDISTDGSHVQAKHEALQKLATFFYLPKPAEPTASSTEPETGAVAVKEEAGDLPEVASAQEMDFDHPDMLILPPPDLYADLTEE